MAKAATKTAQAANGPQTIPPTHSGAGAVPAPQIAPPPGPKAANGDRIMTEEEQAYYSSPDFDEPLQPTEETKGNKKAAVRAALMKLGTQVDKATIIHLAEKLCGEEIKESTYQNYKSEVLKELGRNKPRGKKTAAKKEAGSTPAPAKAPTTAGHSISTVIAAARKLLDLVDAAEAKSVIDALSK